MPENYNTRILIVDDATSLRTVLRAFFISEGYQVVGELAHGSAVLENIARLKPELVCLDYHLPDCNGLELLKQILSAYPQIAVVIITGDSNPHLEGEAAEAGAAGFIRKPFTPAQMSREIRQITHAQALYGQQGKPQALALEEARARAVVADDSATMRMLLRAILNQSGIFVVEEASDGQQAVAAITRNKPELVCLDMDMPVMNGLDALTEIKRAFPSAKVLMVTGRSSRDSILEAGKRGASGYIIKPFEPARVSEAVTRLLGWQP